MQQVENLLMWCRLVYWTQGHQHCFLLDHRDIGRTVLWGRVQTGGWVVMGVGGGGQLWPRALAHLLLKVLTKAKSGGWCCCWCCWPPPNITLIYFIGHLMYFTRIFWLSPNPRIHSSLERARWAPAYISAFIATKSRWQSCKWRKWSLQLYLLEIAFPRPFFHLAINQWCQKGNENGNVQRVGFDI